MATALFTHPDCERHVTPEGHPERVARLQAIAAALSAPEFDALDRREAPLADRADLLRVHPEELHRPHRGGDPRVGVPVA